MPETLVVLFDFDGVLLNSTGSYLLMEKLLQDPQYRWNFPDSVPLTPKDLIRRFESSSRLSDWESLRLMNNNFRDILPSFFLRWKFFFRTGKMIRIYEKQHNRLLDGIKESIEKLHQAGVILGIVSNSKMERLNYWLNRTKIGHFFSVQVTNDDKSRYNVKPSPLPILGALEQLKIQGSINSIQKNRVCFIGDNPSDLQTAHNAKVISIGVLSGRGTRALLDKEKPHFIFNSINELPENLNRIFS
ncbi:MAG: HAD family hydrolase [Promethearchaeota archaeon]